MSWCLSAALVIESCDIVFFKHIYITQVELIAVISTRTKWLSRKKCGRKFVCIDAKLYFCRTCNRNKIAKDQLLLRTKVWCGLSFRSCIVQRAEVVNELSEIMSVLLAPRILCVLLLDCSYGWDLIKELFAIAAPQLVFYCHKSAGAVGGTAEHNKEEKWEIFPFFYQTAQVQRASEEELSSELNLSIVHKYDPRDAELLSTNTQKFVKCNSSQKSYTKTIKQLSDFPWVFQCFGFVWLCLFVCLFFHFK